MVLSNRFAGYHHCEDNKMINVKRKRGLQAHCETTYRNSQCPYIKLGCTGCLIKTENKHNKSRKKDAAKNRPLLSLIVKQPRMYFGPDR